MAMGQNLRYLFGRDYLFKRLFKAHRGYRVLPYKSPPRRLIERLDAAIDQGEDEDALVVAALVSCPIGVL